MTASLEEPLGQARALVLVSDGRRRERLESALRSDGHDVFGASSGPEAAALLREHHPDVIVLDMRLAMDDGAAFAAAFRRNGAQAPEIVLVPPQDAASERVAPADDGVSAAALGLLRARVRRVVRGVRVARGRRSSKGAGLLAASLATLAVIGSAVATATPFMMLALFVPE